MVDADGLHRAISAYLRIYHRHEIELDAPLPDAPSLVVSNHGFGGLVDLNVLSLVRVLRADEDARPVTFLVHQIAWTIGLGRVLESLGCRPASPTATDEAFSQGHHVAVFPGGDVDAAKSWTDRNRVNFSGRSGFAAVAVEHGVPVVPVVTVGAGESLFVLNDGQWLAARVPGLQLLRMKALPISVSIPWGVNVGLVGLLPYVALPTKLRTVVMAPMTPGPDESPSAFASRIEIAMQTRVNRLVAGRKPVLG